MAAYNDSGVVSRPYSFALQNAQTMTDHVHILFVDDEAENRFSFKALFRRRFRVLLAANAEEAIKIIEDHSIQLVLSDQRMPGMKGLELLKWVKEYNEQIIRVLISGSISVENKEEAKELEIIHDWIGKPWKLSELEIFLEEALENAERVGDKE